MGDLPSFQI